MRYEIRRALASDAEDIAAAHMDSIRSIGPQFYPAEVVNAWSAGLSGATYLKAMDAGETFWIAGGVAGGMLQVLGFSSHRVDDDEHGVSVYVRGAAARQGIGSALLRAAEGAAMHAGAARIGIAASLAAVEFYRTHGFHEVGRGEHRLASAVLMPCVFMEKRLGAPDRGSQ